MVANSDPDGTASAGCHDEALSEAAEAVLEDVTALRKPDSKTELDQRRVKTRTTSVDWSERPSAISDAPANAVSPSEPGAGRTAPQAHQMRRGTAGNHGESGPA
jgi:hypothetical protein